MNMGKKELKKMHQRRKTKNQNNCTNWEKKKQNKIAQFNEQ